MRGWHSAFGAILGSSGLVALGACPGADAGIGATTSATAGATTTAGDGSEDTTGIDTLADGDGEGTTAAPQAEVRCAEPPSAAVGADYEHAFEVEPEASWTWSAAGLPPGLSLSPISGTLSGSPTEAGSFAVSVEVQGSGGEGQASCTLEVAPALSVDLEALARPCLGPADALADVLVGGDGSPVTCSTPAGNGDGSRPAGVTVDPDACTIEGAPTPDEFGTWVWITEVEQSGAQAYVPFCITQDTPPAGAFEVTMTADGDPNALLEPRLGTFTPGEPVSFDGGGDPQVVVVGGCGTGACFYGFSFLVGASPLGGDCGQDPCFDLSPSAIVEDGDGNPIGFSHEMFALGPPVPRSASPRPFVLPWELTYCIADNGEDCDGNANIVANAGAHVHVSLLMQPL